MAKTKSFDFTKPESEMAADEFQAYYAARRQALLTNDAQAYAALTCPGGVPDVTLDVTPVVEAQPERTELNGSDSASPAGN